MVQFVDGPWNGRVEDYAGTYSEIQVLIEEDLPLLSYARYFRERRPEPGTPVRFLHIPPPCGHCEPVNICGVGLPDEVSS